MSSIVDYRGIRGGLWLLEIVYLRRLHSQALGTQYDEITSLLALRYDTIEEINVDSKAEYTA